MNQIHIKSGDKFLSNGYNVLIEQADNTGFIASFVLQRDGVIYDRFVHNFSAENPIPLCQMLTDGEQKEIRKFIDGGAFLGRHDTSKLPVWLSHGLEMVEILRMQLAEKERQEDDVNKVCRWTCENDGDDEYWHTACGRDFYFVEGAPKDNELKFCPYCGGKLLEEKEDDPDDDGDGDQDSDELPNGDGVARAGGAVG